MLLLARCLLAQVQNAIHHVELVAVIEAERELVKIERQILCGDLMIDSHDSTLEKRPNVFAAICMDVPANIGLCMVNGVMSKLGGIKPEVGSEFIRMNLASGLSAFPNEICEGSR